MISPDTSVLVAAFASWHEAHDVADERLGSDFELIGHTAVEFVSTVSRLPDPHRVAPAVALEFLRRRSPKLWTALHPRRVEETLQLAVLAGLSGGQLYDALIAMTAAVNGVVLLSLDRRAEPTYRKLGVDFEMIDA